MLLQNGLFLKRLLLDHVSSPLTYNGCIVFLHFLDVFIFNNAAKHGLGGFVQSKVHQSSPPPTPPTPVILHIRPITPLGEGDETWRPCASSTGPSCVFICWANFQPRHWSPSNYTGQATSTCRMALNEKQIALQTTSSVGARLIYCGYLCRIIFVFALRTLFFWTALLCEITAANVYCTLLWRIMKLQYK